MGEGMGHRVTQSANVTMQEQLAEMIVLLTGVFQNYRVTE